MIPNRKTSLNLETPQDSRTSLLLTVLPLESRSLFMEEKIDVCGEGNIWSTALSFEYMKIEDSGIICLLGTSSLRK